MLCVWRQDLYAKVLDLHSSGDARRVIIESDSKVAVDLCNDKSSNTSEIMSICNEIREIKRALSSCSISFVGRDANSAAHLCAKQASSDRRRCLWINYNPGFLEKTLRSDCNPVT